MQQLSYYKSSVQSWIDLLPTPKKRKAQDDPNIVSQAWRKRPRAPLRDVSSNIVAGGDNRPRDEMSASPSTRGRVGRGAGGPTTPRRSGRRTPSEQSVPTRQEDLEEEVLDTDPTPRGQCLHEHILPASSSN